jgi:hypothetical protein
MGNGVLWGVGRIGERLSRVGFDQVRAFRPQSRCPSPFLMGRTPSQTGPPSLPRGVALTALVPVPALKTQCGGGERFSGVPFLGLASDL